MLSATKVSIKYREENRTRVYRGHGRESTYRVSCLDEDGTWAGELANQTLGRGKAGDDTAGCDTLEDVFCVPGDEVAVVDNVLLTID